MADQLYLSYWLRGFTEKNMLRQFERLIRTFPFSLNPNAVSTLRIDAIEYAEPPLLEVSFDGLPDPAEVIEAASQFQNADCAYLVGGFWDLWQRENEWQLAPAAVNLICFGPEFQNELKDHLRAEVGLDSHFLPQPDQPAAAAKVQSNIQSLLRLSHELDDILPVEKRQLWTESGENFVDRLRETLGAPGG